MGNHHTITMKLVHGSEHDHQVKDQGLDGTCFAWASGQAFYSALFSKDSRSNISVKTIANEIVGKFGKKGGDLEEVLRFFCPKYQCSYQKIKSISEMIDNLVKKRTIICGYFFKCLCQHTQLQTFFEKNPEGILQIQHVKCSKNKNCHPMNSGHAVVIIEVEDGLNDKHEKDPSREKYFKLKNSWGLKFADKGYFKISYEIIKKYSRQLIVIRNNQN